MKRLLIAGILVVGAAMSAPAWAQGPPMADPMGAYANPADTGVYSYQTTGWDPSVLAYAAGGLGLAALGLKGFLRLGSQES